MKTLILLTVEIEGEQQLLVVLSSVTSFLVRGHDGVDTTVGTPGWTRWWGHRGGHDGGDTGVDTMVGTPVWTFWVEK